MANTKHAMAGFSLTEMSIVLVIMALIVVGATSGKNMIEASKIRAIVSEVSEHKVAISSFNAKYVQYPGDFSDAEAYWGAANTDNGDNDGHIEFVNDTASVYEGYHTWQHLSLAKMTVAPYPGSVTTAAAVVGTDVPKSKSNGGYFMEYQAFGFIETNALVLGKPVASTATILTNGTLNPSQAQEVDAKMDDGKPGSGIVRGKEGNASAAESCVDDVTDNGISSDDFYKIAASGVDCIIGFQIAGQ